jgi:hypothetical protein
MAFSVTIAIGVDVFAADRVLDDIVKLAVVIHQTDHTSNAIRNHSILTSHGLRQIPPDVMGLQKS